MPEYQHLRADFIKLLCVMLIGLVLILGERKVISEELVVCGCVGTVALAAGYVMLRSLDRPG